jgi:hypothetical protein
MEADRVACAAQDAHGGSSTLSLLSDLGNFLKPSLNAAGCCSNHFCNVAILHTEQDSWTRTAETTSAYFLILLIPSKVSESGGEYIQPAIASRKKKPIGVAISSGNLFHPI